jgi:hypothetical protein
MWLDGIAVDGAFDTLRRTFGGGIEVEEDAADADVGMGLVLVVEGVDVVVDDDAVGDSQCQ